MVCETTLWRRKNLELARRSEVIYEHKNKEKIAEFDAKSDGTFITAKQNLDKMKNEHEREEKRRWYWPTVKNGYRIYQDIGIHYETQLSYIRPPKTVGDEDDEKRLDEATLKGIRKDPDRLLRDAYNLHREVWQIVEDLRDYSTTKNGVRTRQLVWA